MWILFCVVITAVGLTINSFLVAFEKKKIYQDGLIEFLGTLMIQLFISSIVLVVSFYLMVSLEEVNKIRDATSNSNEFWRSVLKGFGYVLGLFAVWYAYLKQISAIKGKN